MTASPAALFRPAAAAVLLSVALSLAHAFGADGAAQSVFELQVPLDQALVIAGGESRNPRSYDPATTHGSGDRLAFSGLVSFDPALRLTGDLAETWDVDSSGTTYTFHLRRNARFHSGRPVTTEDVVYSWERAASPEVGSDTVLTYLGDIVGAREMLAGTADHMRGLRVVDATTLKVTIDAPKPYFLLKLTYPTAFVLDRKNVESGPEWYRIPNGTGPYRLREWDSFDHVLYERNQDFYLGPPAIPYVLVKLFAGESVRLYESGEVDLAGVAHYDAERFLDPAEPLHKELRSGVSLCTDYVLFDVRRPPFDDVNVRKAFSLAFDRDAYIDVLFGGMALPAMGLYPPGLPGHSYSLRGLPYDPAQARRLLEQSSYGSAEALPPIVYTDGGIGTNVNPSAAALAEMWQRNLGVRITVENLEPNYFFDHLYAGDHGQLFAGGWCADYPDPENFADVLFHGDSQQNLGGFDDSELNQQLEMARVERDVEKRMELYQHVEQRIVDEAPALFTTHALSYILVKPYVRGFVLTPIDIPIERYMWLDGK